MKPLYLLLAAALLFSAPLHAERLPNILLILADDLGYGDLSCYNPEAKVQTPNIDALAREGVRFTDAHSPSTVCTPTRYSIQTGRMAFRNGMKGVFDGAGGPCLIEEDRLTLPEMLRRQGYATALFGKWHIGLTFSDAEGNPICSNGLPAVRRIDFSRPIPDGPVNRGFDRFYGTACCPTTDWLYAFIENDRIPVPPVQVLDKTNLPKNAFTGDMRPGLIAPNFDMESVDLVFLEKSREFMEQHVASHPGQPFFLMHSAQGVHLPSLPADVFKNKSTAGPHGDFIMELDYVTGELLATLERLGIADETLVLFTSDNGPETTTTVNMRADYGHDGARPWRGMKRDQWEGGHRVPLIVRWPGKAAPSESAQTVCLTDIMATCAALTGAKLPNDAAEDSFDFSPVLLGRPNAEPVREYTLHQTISLALAIRRGAWKYLDHRGSGGNNYDSPALAPYRIEDAEPDAPGQLYNLEGDPGETRNLYYEHPEIVAELKAQLDTFESSGRSAPLRAPESSLRGNVIDSDTGEPLASRVYLQNLDTGAWYFAEADVPGGSAVPYDVQRGGSFEKHTTLGAHPFRAELPPGTYEVSAEHGKEYFPATQRIAVGTGTAAVELRLHRWIDMAAEGWYSGETHVHRAIKDLPNLLLAEDLNVAFPLSYWVREDDKPPQLHTEVSPTPPQPSVVKVDPTHVYYPMNSEYEIFECAGQRHTLGALFILNQKTPLSNAVPPAAPILRHARAEDALLDLDKHNWPWSLMLLPVLDVDLFELSNNHLWRTDFFFNRFSDPAPEYMHVETDGKGFTEDGWIQFGFESYYTLLNCGFKMTPTAGTASGVHPVPLGFGRVYVHLPEGFSYDAWVRGLGAGHSFVTNGPMLFATLDGADPGGRMRVDGGEPRHMTLHIRAESPFPIDRIEVVVNGKAKACPLPVPDRSGAAYRLALRQEITLDSTSWVAVRCYAKTPDGRTRFAHTAPWHIEVPGRPLSPRQEEIAYLTGRMRGEIERNRDILLPAALDEYRRALRFYENLSGDTQ